MATSLLLKFQGSVVGGVIGDCVGAVYEGMWVIGLEKTLKLVNKIQAGNSAKILLFAFTSNLTNCDRQTLIKS